jgi:predicted ATP-dependent endonuclease of OLD family
VWKKNDFANIISSIFDNRNFSTFRYHTGYDLQALQTEDYGAEFLTALWDAVNGKSTGSLMLKSAFSTETAMNNIFRDWYNIHYVVISGADTIEQMSPGKKASVLLELLINLEKNKCPILIDQPEDDLDNRSIYFDLVQFIRKKKLDRQIIVVTHNANVVLGADAEEVIVANQNGHDTPNATCRFEYRSGSIENDLIERDSCGNPLPGVLNGSGIQAQICDILEGGKVAFELRRNKYSAAPNQ